MCKRICARCKSTKVVDTGSYGGTTYYRCDTCHHLGDKDDFPEYTIFHYLTASPEVLAENSIYFRVSRDGEHYTYSSPWIDTVHETRAEAIAATVAKLKEQEK